MATTPFSTVATTYAGQALPKDRSYAWMADRLWLGRAGNMIQLPPNVPGTGKTAVTDGETVHELPGGGVSTTRFAFDKGTWVYQFPMMINRDWQILDGFRRRLFGQGPWCLPDPADTNYLPEGASLAGSLNAVAEGWAATVGTVAYDATQTPAEAPSGVLRWNGQTTNSQAGIGQLVTGALTADTSLGCPFIGALPACASMYVASAGSVTVRAQVLGIRASDGAIISTNNGTATALTSTPQQIFASAAAGGSSSIAYWMLALQTTSAGIADVLISCPQLELGVTTPSSWAAGAGVARVLMTGFDAPVVDGFGSRNVTMTLQSSG